MIRNAIICGIASLAVLVTLPAVSQADTSPKTLCVTVDAPAPRAGCYSTWEYSRDGLQMAIDNANATTTYQGDDTIRIDPGTITISQLAGQPSETVFVAPQFGFGAIHIEGAGVGQTILQGVYTEVPASHTLMTWNVSSAPTSSISDLTVSLSSEVAFYTGLQMNGGEVNRVAFNVPSGGESAHQGLYVTGDGVTVRDSSFLAQGQFVYGIYNPSHDLRVFDSEFRSNNPASALDEYGIGSGGTLEARRLKFTGEKTGIHFFGTGLEVYDSLFDMREADTAVSVTPGAAVGYFLLHGVTVVGGFVNQAGVKFIGSSHQVSGDIRDSLFDLTGTGSTEILCAAPGAGATSLYIFNSMYATATVEDDCFMSPIGTLLRSGSLQPTYLNAGIGDYRPAAGSPVIDAGSPTSFRPFDPKLDLGGKPRFVDGNGDGSALIDIGAYEFQPAPPSTPGDGTTAPPDPFKITLSKPTGKFKLKKKIFPFKAGTARSKPRIAVSSNRAATVTLILLKPKAGYAKGSKCGAKKPKVGKRKRCDLPIKGKQVYRIPLGSSFLQFGAKWADKKLKPGKYVLTMKARGLNDAPKSILNVIR